MRLPDTRPWTETITSLHAAMQVLRALRLLGVPPMPNDLHYGTIPVPRGATTGPLSFGGEVVLDYEKGVLCYEQAGSPVFAERMEGRSQTRLFDAVVARLAALGLVLEPERGKIDGTEPLRHEPEAGGGYAALQWRMHDLLGLFKARLQGAQTPVILWPHGFDLSTIWSPGGMDERADPHLNVGFSPGTPDIGEPYLYAYAWPEPPGLADALPPLFAWYEGWSTPGALLRYSRMQSLAAPEVEASHALAALWVAVRERIASVVPDG